VAEPLSSRFQQLLRQLFSLKEPYSGNLLEDIFPVFALQDPAEAHLQLGKEVFIVFGGAVAVPAAAELATIDLAPTVASSRMLLDVLSLSLNNVGAVAMNVTIGHVGFAAAAPTVVTQLTPLDGRRIGSEVSPQRASFGLSQQIPGFAVPLNFQWGLTLPAGTGVVIPWKATLYRSALRFQGTAVNNAMRISVIGQERLAEPSEERQRIQSAP
jgi:hypothetical protein